MSLDGINGQSIQGVITTRSNRMKFRLGEMQRLGKLPVCCTANQLQTLSEHPGEQV